MFEVGDKVVYPGHGVAMVEKVEEKTVEQHTMRFFKLKFLYKDMTVLVPLSSNNEAIGIRALASDSEIEQAMAELHKDAKRLDATDFTPSSWNKRNKHFQLKIQSGSIIDIATIYRDLMYCARYKELSFGEKNLLGLAEELLLQEVVLVKKQTRDEAISKLRQPFAQFGYTGHMVHTAQAPVL